MLGVAPESVDHGIGPRPDPVRAEPRARRPSTQPARNRQHEPGRLLVKLVAIGFWGTLVSLIVSAAAAVGFVLLFLLPLLGLGYLLFCFIALTGDRSVQRIRHVQCG